MVFTGCFSDFGNTSLPEVSFWFAAFIQLCRGRTHVTWSHVIVCTHYITHQTIESPVTPVTFVIVFQFQPKLSLRAIKSHDKNKFLSFCRRCICMRSGLLEAYGGQRGVSLLMDFLIARLLWQSWMVSQFLMYFQVWAEQAAGCRNFAAWVMPFGPNKGIKCPPPTPVSYPQGPLVHL